MPLKVLVIEDEPSQLEWLEIVLKHEGCKVRTAPNGLMGRAIFHTWHPQLVILNQGLPDVNGLGLLVEFKSEQPDVPVIMTSGSVSEEVIKETIKKGAQAFLEKPFDSEELLSELKKAAIAPHPHAG